MLRALITAALVLATGAAAEQAKVRPAAVDSSDRVHTSDHGSFPNFDQAAERQLLELANHSRARAGAPPLQLDPGMTRAARAHVDLMVQQQQLSHQLEGEPSLPRRLADATDLHLDHAGENVVLEMTAEGAHEQLMLSPPHRENLLDPGYNVAGFGAIRAGDRLYVVEDFGHSVPAYTAGETEETIVGAVSRLRRAAHLPELEWKLDAALRDAVCSMARQDRLGTRSMHELAQRYSVISYTNLHPEVLPANATRWITDHRFKSLGVGVCYARTRTFPSGVYWVGLAFY